MNEARFVRIITGSPPLDVYDVALLRAPEPAGAALNAHEKAFLALQPKGEAEEFVAWLVAEHGYQRLACDEHFVAPWHEREWARAKQELWGRTR